jgi:hypothetical protein
MRYGYRVEMPGVTQEQYDGLHAQIASIIGGIPHGLLVHIAGPIEGGWYVTEVWASKADCDQFMAKMAPMFSSPDAPPMNIQEFSVYNCETTQEDPVLP